MVQPLFEDNLRFAVKNQSLSFVSLLGVPCVIWSNIQNFHFNLPIISYRLVFEPAVREVTKTVLRRVRRCCKGWKGINCNQRMFGIYCDSKSPNFETETSDKIIVFFILLQVMKTIPSTKRGSLSAQIHLVSWFTTTESADESAL